MQANGRLTVTNASNPWPTELRVREKGRVLRLTFDDGLSADIQTERLRAASPSADKSPPGAGVTIIDLETIGNYAARFTFSDGHATGLYSWDLLRKLAAELIESAWWNAPHPNPSPAWPVERRSSFRTPLRGRGAYSLVPLAGADECYAFA